MGLGRYLTDVLGITRFGISGRREFKVVFVLENPLSPAAQQLLVKMAEAMRLQPLDFLIVNREIPSDIQAQAFVSFDPAFQAPPGMPSVLTISPELLVKDSTLKKKAWNDLQLIMKHISIVERPQPS